MRHGVICKMGSCWKIPAPERLQVWCCTPSQQDQICPSSENLKEKPSIQLTWSYLSTKWREVTIWLIGVVFIYLFFYLHLQLTCYCVSTHQNRWTSWRREELVSSAINYRFSKTLLTAILPNNGIFWHFLPFSHLKFRNTFLSCSLSKF